MAATRAARVTRLLHQARSTFAGCQCHGCSAGTGHSHSPRDVLAAGKAIASGGRTRTRSYATPIDVVGGGAPPGDTDYAFEVAASNLRFGKGVTREVGLDFANLKAKKVGVYADPTVAKLRPMLTALESLDAAGVKYEVFSECTVEPTQERSVFITCSPCDHLLKSPTAVGRKPSTLRATTTFPTSSPSAAGPPSTRPKSPTCSPSTRTRRCSTLSMRRSVKVCLLGTS